VKTNRQKIPLLIPVENQVRELDPKLLLACIAARRGFTSVIGSHREIDLRITSFARSVYLSKSMTASNLRMFDIMRKIGHEIVTWDEEALVHLPPETYYSRRLSPVAIQYISHLFAWGEDNAELWRRYPALPEEVPIHVTGNPRSDMLRPELLPFYDRQAEELRQTHGDFILVNTNFNHVNAFFPAQNLFQPLKKPGEKPQFGKAAVGMNRKYAEGLRSHKQGIFEAFQQMIPRLEKAFPAYSVIVRPHPTENQQVYREIAARCSRVCVTNEGNVVPWLMAAKALIHNGCTTGVEAYTMQVPAISYRAQINEDYDLGFYRLPNLVSHQCFDFEQLCDILGRILNAELGAADGDERKALVDGYLTARDGPLACERIVGVLEKMAEGWEARPAPPLKDRITGRSLAQGRRLGVSLRKYMSRKHAPPEFHHHRYPGISIEELKKRILHFQKILGDNTPIAVTQIFKHVFRISAA
jgi:surface carbohydrate biosynthesis protein